MESEFQEAKKSSNCTLLELKGKIDRPLNKGITKF